MILDSFSTIIFDCDGVILDSNSVKSNAFYQAAIDYGEDFAETLVEYHKKNGGVSRYKKFKWFVDNFVKEFKEQALKKLLSAYAEEVKRGLLECDMVDCLETLKSQTPNASWMVVSGGDQIELRKVFFERGIEKYFDAGIFGSPDAKEVIIERELKNRKLIHPALFIGDSYYDHVASSGWGLDFIFVSGWTEFQDWENYCYENKILIIENLRDLIKEQL